MQTKGLAVVFIFQRMDDLGGLYAGRAGWLLACCLMLGSAFVGEGVAVEPSVAGEDLYRHKIKQLLTEKCSACHGVLKQEAGLRLDAIQFIRAGGDSGAAVVAGKPQESELLFRVATDDLGLRMPPEGEGTALSEEELQWLKEWIEAGLPGPEAEDYLAGISDHWAYRPVQRPPMGNPDLHSARDKQTRMSPSTAIDSILARVHRAAGLQTTDYAGDEAWLRRVTLDLTGIPPRVGDLQDFLQDRSPKRFEKVVDRLLADPAYGQRWGRHWMDVWRYSDWNGYKQQLRGSQRHIWHWRDWIIESLNANKPYDQMLREMLAGDELAPNDPDTLRATGFLARNYHNSNRDIWLDAAVEHTGKAFLGLTFNCAKCHDHKYDPIAHRAYYQFRAIFEPHDVRTEQVAGQLDTKQAGIPRVLDAKPEEPTFVYLRGNEKHPVEDDPVSPGVVDWIEAEFSVQPISLPPRAYYPALKTVVKQNRLAAKGKAVDEARSALQKATAALLSARQQCSKLSDAMASFELATLQFQTAVADEVSLSARYAAEEAKYLSKPVDSEDYRRRAREAAQLEHHHRLASATLKVAQAEQALKQLTAEKREEHEEKKQLSKQIADAEAKLKSAAEELAELPKTLEDECVDYQPVGELLPRESTGRRLALARWITHPANPLTPRVAVNHMWMRHFGQPLVESVFDFGMNTPEPELLELLDWLAAELIDSGWNMKHLHRLIVLSEAYARSSSPAACERNFASNSLTRSANAQAEPIESQTTSHQLDPDNRLFWRFNVQRLDAEQVRDSLLAVAGRLDCELGGPDIDFSQGESVYRRSVYFRHAYEKQMSMLVLFDAASPNECYRRRPSVIPQQALVLANSGLARDMSRYLARDLQRLTSHAVEENEDFVRQLFLATLTRQPNASELEACLQFLEQQQQAVSQADQLTTFEGSSKSQTTPATSARMRARESLAAVLLNHNDFVSLR